MSRYRLTVNEQFDILLARAACLRGTSKAEVIRRAVALYAFLKNEIKIPGRKISFTDQNDNVLQDVVLS